MFPFVWVPNMATLTSSDDRSEIILVEAEQIPETNDINQR